jgi:hypothetical protein
MNWYYLWPIPALCLLLAVRRSAARFGVCSVALVASMVLGDRRMHEIGLWWPALMATAVVMLFCAAPTPARWPGLVARLGRARGRTGPIECTSMKETAGAGQHRA